MPQNFFTFLRLNFPFEVFPFRLRTYKLRLNDFFVVFILGWQIALTLFVTWGIAAGLSFIYLLGDRIMLYDNPKDHLVDTHFCRNFMPLNENATHTVVVFFIQLVIPLLAMSVLYSLIAIELRKVAACHLFAQNERDVSHHTKLKQRQFNAHNIHITLDICSLTGKRLFSSPLPLSF